jgi:hypothetical protein
MDSNSDSDPSVRRTDRAALRSCSTITSRSMNKACIVVCIIITANLILPGVKRSLRNLAITAESGERNRSWSYGVPVSTNIGAVAHLLRRGGKPLTRVAEPREKVAEAVVDVVERLRAVRESHRFQQCVCVIGHGVDRSR